MKILPFVLLLVAAVLASCQTTDKASHKTPVAVVAGQPIYEEDLAAAAEPQLRQLRNEEYDIKRRALDDLINQKLVEAEAKKRGTTVDALQQQVDSKVAAPTEAEIETLYRSQKDRLGKRSIDDVRPQLIQALTQAKTQEARQDFVKRLRDQAQISILLEAPKTQVAWDPKRLRGNPNAPITIVEFSDFQCPYCGRVQPALNELRAKYADRVKIAYLDFPLLSIHPRAEPAAEAARCAGEQGKFWEYHDLLWASQSKLDDAALSERARTLNLDQQQFESCRASGKYRAKVEEDLQEGMKAGVSGTPGFFINGVFLNGAVPASAFEQIITDELKQSARK
jgi:protein-disulfide isomerase